MTQLKQAPTLPPVWAEPIAPTVAALTNQQRRNEPATPAEPDLRHELKFTVPIAQAHRIGAWLRGHAASFGTLYPARQVNSLYLDSIDLASYAQNVSGIAERGKLRIRWYGENARGSVASRSATLELKCKQGLLGWKELYAIDGELELNGTTWRESLRRIRGRIAPTAQLTLDRSPVPVVVISYQREYFTSADGIVRLTVDRNLRAFDQRRSQRPNLRFRLPIPDHVVVELKCAASERKRLAEIAADFPVRVARCSKYVGAVATAMSC